MREPGETPYAPELHRRAGHVILPVLLACASAILFFRFFITVDGPLHMLHAGLLDSFSRGDVPEAGGIRYNAGALHGRLGDAAIIALLRAFSPEQAHNLFAAITGCALMLALTAYARMHGARMNAALLWLAPLGFSFVLIMGLFHFLLGVAVSFGTVACWKRRASAPEQRWFVLLIGAIIAWGTHRAAPVILAILFIASYLPEVIGTASTTGMEQRRARAPLVVIAVAMVLLAGCVFVIAQGIPSLLPRSLPAFDAALLSRPLVLLEPAREMPLVLGMAVLVLLPLGAALWARFRLGLRLVPQDAPLLAALPFQVAAWLGNTPHGRQLLIAERCQWLALLAVVLWLAAMAGTRRDLVATLIGVPALLALPLHIVRTVNAERSFAQLQRPYDLAMEAGSALPPGSLVLPVTTGSNALLQHIEACLALRHDGVLLAPRNQTPISGAPLQTDARITGLARDPYWLLRHWRRGIPPEVGVVLFLGDGARSRAGQHPWPTLLGAGFAPSYENSGARILTARAPVNR